MDKITLNRVELPFFIGVTEEERAEQQPLFFDISVFLDASVAAKTKNLEDTVNYVEVYDLLVKLSHEKYVLIEELAEKIAALVLEQFPITSVEVTLEKPGAMKGRHAQSASLTISRSHE